MTALGSCTPLEPQQRLSHSSSGFLGGAVAVGRATQKLAKWGSEALRPVLRSCPAPFKLLARCCQTLHRGAPRFQTVRRSELFICSLRQLLGQLWQRGCTLSKQWVLMLLHQACFFNNGYTQRLYARYLKLPKSYEAFLDPLEIQNSRLTHFTPTHE